MNENVYIQYQLKQFYLKYTVYLKFTQFKQLMVKTVENEECRNCRTMFLNTNCESGGG